MRKSTLGDILTDLYLGLRMRKGEHKMYSFRPFLWRLFKYSEALPT